MSQTSEQRPDAGAVLTAAADYLAQPGHWLQGAPQSGEGCCAVRAIRIHSPNEQTALDALDRARKAAGVGVLWLWNDAPGRTQAQVVETLRKASKAEGAS